MAFFLFFLGGGDNTAGFQSQVCFDGLLSPTKNSRQRGVQVIAASGKNIGLILRRIIESFVVFPRKTSVCVGNPRLFFCSWL